MKILSTVSSIKWINQPQSFINDQKNHVSEVLTPVIQVLDSNGIRLLWHMTSKL